MKESNIRCRAVIAGVRTAIEVKRCNRQERLGLEESQIIVITSTCSAIFKSVDKLLIHPKETFSYVLKRPINQYYLSRLLAYIVRGYALYQAIAAPVMRLPSVEEELGGSATPSHTPAHRPQGANDLSVLMVDDNDLCRKALVRLLNTLTKTIATGVNGVEGLQAFENASPPIDLAIIDCNMPEMDGLTLIKRIRELEAERKSAQKATIVCTELLM
jgi:CheY-like chemotaxis protein